MDISALYTSIPYNDGIAATASGLNTNSCQFPDAILQLFCFILDHNVFTFSNLFFIQTHGTAMGTRFVSQYANIFMYSSTHTRICLDEEEQNGHLKMLKDALIRTGYDAQLIDHQFRRATAKNCDNLLRRQTRVTSYSVPVVVQYFTGVEKLRHV
eukprot:g29659.t1